MIKHITPDSPDFAAIVASITPIGKVHSMAFPKTSIWEERAPNCKYRRRGDNDK